MSVFLQANDSVAATDPDILELALFPANRFSVTKDTGTCIFPGYSEVCILLVTDHLKVCTEVVY
jgi:hypothetical protein